MRATPLPVIALLAALSGPLAAADQAVGFAAVVAPGTTVEKLAGGMRFIEGPVWLAEDGGKLVFSDIPADELKSWSRAKGLATYRKPSHAANGNTLDPMGRLVTCEHGLRRVTRTAVDGTIAAVAERYQGKRFSSPNDVVVKKDGSIWFTDPPYGIPQGEKAELERNAVYRIAPDGKAITMVNDSFDHPNGLCFSPDEQSLYIAESGKAPFDIRVYAVGADGTLSDGRVFANLDDKPAPDGMRVDQDGRLWTSAGDGVRVYTPAGALLGTIPVPEQPANLCFGGSDGHTLFITARTGLYALPVLVGRPH
ncbi:MAG: SMP-30/gluconolactonase/LRE family protein [Planctomycetes bacterium]|nr:SMP-30/gluconolactonase/LRE family protein [Planctomycetota bacterium]